MSGYIKNAGAVKKYLLSLFICLLFAASFLLISCAVLYSTNDPAAKSDVASYVALFATCLASGFTVSKLFGGVKVAAAVGVVFALITSVAAAIVRDGEFDALREITVRLAMIAAFAASGYPGGAGRRRAKYRRRKIRRR